MIITTPQEPAATSIDRTAIRSLGSTVAVFAHPDDEAYIAGGVLAALRDLGQRVVCVTATRGDAGNGLHDAGAAAARTALAAQRTDELARTLAVLGVEEHHWLDYPDGRLDGVPESEAVERLVRVLAAVQPRTVLSFGPDGFTGHPDHCTVARWTERAVARTGPQPQLLQAVTTQAVLDDSRDVNDAFEIFVWGRPPVVAEADLDLQLRLDGAHLARKVAALREQHSQTAALVEAIGDDRYARWVRVESFRRADVPTRPAIEGQARGQTSSVRRSAGSISGFG